MLINVHHNILYEYYLVMNYVYVVILYQLLMMVEQVHDDYQLLNDQQHENYLYLDYKKKEECFTLIDTKDLEK